MENHTPEYYSKIKTVQIQRNKIWKDTLKSVKGLLKEVHFYVQASASFFWVMIIFVFNVLEDSSCNHWFYGINIEARD